MRYQVDRYAADETRVETIRSVHSMIYTRKLNDIGGLQLVMPQKVWKPGDWEVGQVLELWREKNGLFQLQNETAYLVQDVDYYNQSGRNLLRVYALDANFLLGTRIVASPAGTAETELTGKADDVMKDIVRNEFMNSGGTAPERVIPTISVQANVSQSAEVTKGCAWQNVLQALQELAESAEEQGVPTYFDLVRTGAAFNFRTYVNQRGVDHSRTSGDVRLVGEQYGNLADARLSIVHSEAWNYVYAGGQGEGTDREIKEVSDETRIGLGYPYGRKEYFKDARNQEEADGVEADAYAALAKGKPKTTMTGKLRDTPGMQYGIDYGFGDVLSVEAFGDTIDCQVSSLRMSYDSENGEAFEIYLKGERA